MSRTIVLALLMVFAPLLGNVRAASWQAGIATKDITPKQFMWMSGYASRRKPAEGKDTSLYAKVLVVKDAEGRAAVLVTMDLIGIGRELSLKIRRAIADKHKLQLSQVALCTSHTHSGPVVGRNLMPMYFLDKTQYQRVVEYGDTLGKTIPALVDDAFTACKPAELSFLTGQATFAVNRRNNAANAVPQLRKEGKLRGPFDHDVPIIAVKQAGKVRAVVFGYACHATTLSYFRWSGDYPAYAQESIEKAMPGVTALFFAGCGADQNPLPRRKVVLAQQYGQQLADGVVAALKQKAQPIIGKLHTRYNEIDLTFDTLPTKDELVARSESNDRYDASRAKLLLAQIQKNGSLSKTYPYPVQTWRLGDELHLVILGGEVVVDFAIRLKKEFGRSNTFVAAYANDVMAYIPSLRVLKEGGYEGGGAMKYYGLPSKWSPTVEEDVIRAVAQQIKLIRSAGSN